MKIVEAQDRTRPLIGILLRIWESSVKATHLFLSEKEIERIGRSVPRALRAVPHLLVAETDGGHPVAFAGTDGHMLEMLFVSAEHRGKGIGKRLLRHAVENCSVRELTVNEQNPLAVGFYEHMGFTTYKRTETDGQGDPYPLLYMKRTENPANG